MFSQLKDHVIDFLLFYLDIIIKPIREKLIYPLQELEGKFGYYEIMRNKIYERYWRLMKQYKDILIYKQR